MQTTRPLYSIAVPAFLFSLIIVQSSHGQVGMIAGWAGSKINDKAAWNKFKNEQSVSDTVLYGDTLFCLRTSSEGLNKLAGSNKYRELGSALGSLESYLDETRERVLNGQPIERLLSYIEGNITRVAQINKKFDVDHYRREHDFYTRYQAGYAGRQKALADSLALVRQQKAEAAAQQQAAAASARQQAAETNSGTAAATQNTPAPPKSTTTKGGKVIYGRLDSASVVILYGSIDEYNEQYLFQRQSSHGHLVLFAGKHNGWVNELIGYLEERSWVVNGFGGVDDARSITLQKGSNKVTITTHINKASGKIQRLVVTGKDLSVEQLFVEYWDVAEIKYDQLMEKGIFYHDVLTDKISLVSKPEGSTLTVAANPKVSRPGK